MGFCGVKPQRVRYLPTLRTYGVLNAGLLRGSEAAPRASTATTSSGPNGCPATGLEQVHADPNRRVARSSHANDLHDADALLVQSHDLLAPLVELLQGLLTRVLSVHEAWSARACESSDFFGPGQ